MSGQSDLFDALRDTSVLLRVGRKSIAGNGSTQALPESGDSEWTG
jgi:hypothetical protein